MMKPETVFSIVLVGSFVLQALALLCGLIYVGYMIFRLF